MKTFACASAALLESLLLVAPPDATGASLAKPCSVRSHAIAGVGPCFGSAGMTLAVTVFHASKTRLTALRFEPPPVGGTPPEAVVTPLLGRGRTLTAAVPKDLCHAGNNSRWQVWLLGPYGKRLGRIGDFTIVGCAEDNAH
jgi:hypothetical protein